MDIKLEHKLVEKYPKIFKNYGGDMRITCMAFGFECGDGWYNLINELCENITTLIGDKDIEVTADQVKEKFGGLSFYYSVTGKPSLLSNLTYPIQRYMFSKKLGKAYWSIVDFRKKFWRTIYEKISDIINEAERGSYLTCETCGEPGRTRGGSWLKTTCNSCQKKFDEGKRPWGDNWNNPKSLTIYELMFGKDNE